MEEEEGEKKKKDEVLFTDRLSTHQRYSMIPFDDHSERSPVHKAPRQGKVFIYPNSPPLGKTFAENAHGNFFKVLPQSLVAIILQAVNMLHAEGPYHQDKQEVMEKVGLTCRAFAAEVFCVFNDVMYMSRVADEHAMRIFQGWCPGAKCVAVYSWDQLRLLCASMQAHPDLVVRTLIFGNGLPLDLFDKLKIKPLLKERFDDFLEMQSVFRDILSNVLKLVVYNSGDARDVVFTALPNLRELRYNGPVKEFNLDELNDLEILAVNSRPFAGWKYLSKLPNLHELNCEGSTCDVGDPEFKNFNVTELTLPKEIATPSLKEKELTEKFPNVEKVTFNNIPSERLGGLKGAKKLKEVYNERIGNYVRRNEAEYLDVEKGGLLRRLDVLSFSDHDDFCTNPKYMSNIGAGASCRRPLGIVYLPEITEPMDLSGWSAEKVAAMKVHEGAYFMGANPPTDELILHGVQTEEFFECVKNTMVYSSQIKKLTVYLHGEVSEEYLSRMKKLTHAARLLHVHTPFLQ